MKFILNNGSKQRAKIINKTLYKLNDMKLRITVQDPSYYI